MTTRIDRDGTYSAHWLQWMLAAILALGFACGGEGTTGKNVILHTRIVSDLPADHTVTTSMGWTVTLKKAVIASGPLYYYDGEPALTPDPAAGSGVFSRHCLRSRTPGRTPVTTWPETPRARCWRPSRSTCSRGQQLCPMAAASRV